MRDTTHPTAVITVFIINNTMQELGWTLFFQDKKKDLEERDVELVQGAII